MASKNPLTMVLNARRLKSLIYSRNVDLVHARSRAPAWSAFHATRYPVPGIRYDLSWCLRQHWTF